MDNFVTRRSDITFDGLRRIGDNPSFSDFEDVDGIVADDAMQNAALLTQDPAINRAQVKMVQLAGLGPGLDSTSPISNSSAKRMTVQERRYRG